MRALVVEDDPTAARGIIMILTSSGNVVDHVETGQVALDRLEAYGYDVILLDLGLEDCHGYDVIRRIRAARLETPVLIVSGVVEPHAKTQALNLGADDYISKPYDKEELLFRISAVLKRSRCVVEPNIRVGSLEMDLCNREIKVNDIALNLTTKEYAILEMLVRRKGSMLTKDTLFNHLYGGTDEPGHRIIDTFISKLRRKLSAVGLCDLIETIYGQGYMLREPIIEVVSKTATG